MARNAGDLESAEKGYDVEIALPPIQLALVAFPFWKQHDHFTHLSQSVPACALLMATVESTRVLTRVLALGTSRSLQHLVLDHESRTNESLPTPSLLSPLRLPPIFRAAATQHAGGPQGSDGRSAPAAQP